VLVTVLVVVTDVFPVTVAVFDAVRLFEKDGNALSVGAAEKLEDDDADTVIEAVAETEAMLEPERSDVLELVPVFVAVKADDGDANIVCGLTVSTAELLALDVAELYPETLAVERGEAEDDVVLVTDTRAFVAVRRGERVKIIVKEEDDVPVEVILAAILKEVTVSNDIRADIV